MLTSGYETRVLPSEALKGNKKRVDPGNACWTSGSITELKIRKTSLRYLVNSGTTTPIRTVLSASIRARAHNAAW